LPFDTYAQMTYSQIVRYEWDEGKRAAKLAKHGTMGMGFSFRVLLAVWTERAPETIRIISARRASRAEARHYPEN